MLTTTTPPDTVNQPGPSKASSQPICAICKTEPSKYTCPRCTTKTCSLPCSRTHKSATGCSGERDRAAYVPMNRYSYSALMNDYVFLEEIGRKVESWGRNIAESRIDTHCPSKQEWKGRGRGMAETTRRPRRGKDRKNVLAMQLSVRDIDMDILPTGMHQASINSSYWDLKGKRALLTVEFVFEPPPDPLTRKELRPVSIITHKKDWDQNIRQIIRASIQETKKTREYEELLRWLNLEEKDEAIPSSVLCLMKKPRSYNDRLDLNPKRPAYYKLDWNEKLSKALRNKHFLEFPTILLMDESSFDGVLYDDTGSVEDMQERRVKRRKLDPSEAKKTLTGLVGGYGSDDEKPNALSTLADYSEGEANEDAFESDEESIPDEVEEEETSDLQDSFDAEQVVDDMIGDDNGEEIDWGDDEIAEDEAKLAELSAAIQQRYSSR